jgi:glycosyltransferase involved in cell wall biosynthesis
VFADDWGRHPSSAQHLVRHLLSDHSVSWINTIGTRAPSLSGATLCRGLEKVFHWGRVRALAPCGPAPRIYSPLMYPGFRSALQRGVNAGLLAHFLRRHIVQLADAVIISTVPIVADLPERVPARRWIYYCVDDFSAWPGLDSQPLRSMEQKYVARADRIIAAGDNLAARMRALGRESQVISHGIDLEHWRCDGQATTLLDGFERPIVLFWGLIDRRLDLPALRALDQSMSAGTIALVGPQQDPDPRLDTLSYIRRLGPLAYDQLPALGAAADVLIMPYADSPVTRAMQPLKLKEYLATGRPVVSTRLPAVVEWDDCLDVADGPAQFALAVHKRCISGLSGAQSAARERLQRESWKAKAECFVKVLFTD